MKRYDLVHLTPGTLTGLDAVNTLLMSQLDS